MAKIVLGVLWLGLSCGVVSAEEGAAMKNHRWIGFSKRSGVFTHYMATQF